MKSYFIITITACLLLWACKSSNHIHSYGMQMKESYVYDFKITYFKKLLIQGFDNSGAINMIIAADHSGYGEPILSLEDYKIIDSLVVIDKKTIIQDSLNSVGRVAEGAQGKHVLTYALYKFQSKWLDSLANARYKIFWRLFKQTSKEE